MNLGEKLLKLRKERDSHRRRWQSRSKRPGRHSANAPKARRAGE